MPRIEVHVDRCEGNGFSEQSPPEEFRLDNNGDLNRTQDEVAAVQGCPLTAPKLLP
jgi:ferredoxin